MILSKTVIEIFLLHENIKICLCEINLLIIWLFVISSFHQASI